LIEKQKRLEASMVLFQNGQAGYRVERDGVESNFYLNDIIY
jgi:hypothetical protein